MPYTPLGDKTVQSWISILGQNTAFNALSQDQKILCVDRGQQECAMLSKENNLEFYKAADYQCDRYALIVGSDQGIYKSTTYGDAWSDLYPMGAVQVIAADNVYIYAYCTNALYRSVDGGDTWTQLTGLTIVGSNHTFAIGFIGRIIFVSMDNALWRSLDYGDTWTQCTNSGIYGLSGAGTERIKALVSIGTTLFAGELTQGMFRSPDNGETWTVINTGLTSSAIRSLGVNGTTLYAGTWAAGINKSMNNGTLWVPVNTGIDLGGYIGIYSFAFSGDSIFAGAYGEGMYLSMNGGTSWSVISAWGYTTPLETVSTVVINPYLFAAMINAGIKRYALDNAGNWFLSGTPFLPHPMRGLCLFNLH